MFLPASYVVYGNKFAFCVVVVSHEWRNHTDEQQDEHDL